MTRVESPFPFTVGIKEDVVQDDTVDVQVPPGVDPDQTNAARLYSLLINPNEGQFLPIDVEVANQLRAAAPEIQDIAANNRIFVRRAARFFVEQDLKQILDLGSGLPADENTHEVAHAIDESVRVVYDDHDPMTAAHADHLLAGSQNVEFLSHDVRDVDAVLNDPKTRRLIDFDQPVGIMMASILQLFGDEVDTHGIVRRYLDAVPSGSYLALSHFTTVGPDPARMQGLLDVMAGASEPLVFRTPEEIERYFEGMELVQPYFGSSENDLVWVNRWHATDPARADESGAWLLAGVARKP